VSVCTSRTAPQRFTTTRWSLILQANEGDGRAALGELCRAYWSPVNAFIRGHGLSQEDAADVTQSFFEKLLTRNDLGRADQARGKFRSWLRTCARNHLYNWFEAGGGITVGGQALHVDVETHAHELKDEQTAERFFDRRWALTVLDRALARLKQRYERGGKADIFEHLRGEVSGDPSTKSDKDLSRLLGKSVSAIKVQRLRLRQRFKECLRAEVCETVASQKDVDEEIRRLIDALA
jgi:RNA polymerase sigma factor (sigma-70 family)